MEILAHLDQHNAARQAVRVAICFAIIVAFAVVAAAPAAAEPRVAGTYRCISIRTGAQTVSCQGPALVLFPQGLYQLGNKFGTYVVRGDRLVLSGMRVQQPFRLQRSREIVFEYVDRGRRHQVKFRGPLRLPRGQALL